MDNRVSAAGVGTYNLDLLIGAVERHFFLLGVWDDLRPGMRVVLKPNLLSRHVPEHAVTTHPAVVDAVVRVLQAHDITDITLADSPGGPYSVASLQGIYSASGMARVAANTGIHLNLETGWRTLSFPEGALCHEFNIIEPVANADFVINLCKLKTHAMVAFSGAVKNLFGCIPGLQKPELHFRFPEQKRFTRMLVDLARLVAPGVTVMDAVVGMEGDGPAAGKPLQIGLTLAARNLFALDLGATWLAGFQPKDVGTVAHAIEDGLCPAKPDAIEWIGDGPPAPIPGFRHPHTKPLSFGGHVPHVIQWMLEPLESRFLAPRPAITTRKCTGCGKCAESCAPGAVLVVSGKARIDYKKCIRCYCCHELCPVHAVHIRRAGILRF